MKVRCVAIVLAAGVALTLGPAGQLGAAGGRAVHHGKGIVLAVDLGGTLVAMTEEPLGTHTLVLDERTRIVDREGRPVPASALGTGDLVGEECVRSADGRFVATLIRVLRPAWMELASPE